MELTELITALSDAASYPHPADDVEVHQTHISVVFLAGDYAYKIKKPLDLGFLDYSTLERRRHFCEREVDLNRRLAPSVYLGVVPVVLAGTALQVDGPGEVVEWAVRMIRLPEEATLRERLRRLLPCPRRLRVAHRGLRAVRDGCPERSRELRAIGGTGRHHAEP